MQVRYDREDSEVATTNKAPGCINGFGLFFAGIFTLLWLGALTGGVIWLNIFFWGEIFG